MKVKLLTIMASAMALMLILLTGSPLEAAGPTGEVKYLAPMFGYERWIPRVESMHATYLRLRNTQEPTVAN